MSEKEAALSILSERMEDIEVLREVLDGRGKSSEEGERTER